MCWSLLGPKGLKALWKQQRQQQHMIKKKQSYKLGIYLPANS